jgi:hypothetical protein
VVFKNYFFQSGIGEIRQPMMCYALTTEACLVQQDLIREIIKGSESKEQHFKDLWLFPF